MLQFMRHLAQSWLFKGLMLLLIISFGIWGIGDIFHGNPLQRSVAHVGSEAVSVQALQREFQQGLIQARQKFGNEITPQQAKQLGLLDKSLNNIIERSVVDQDIKRLGINVGAKAVLDKLAAQPQFRDKDGNFNRALFQQLLVQSNLSERDFLAQGMQDLARHQLIDAFDNHPKVAQFVKQQIFKAHGQKRVLDVITIKNDTVNVAAADDKTLHDFYQQNPVPFTAPEYRGITIARLSTEDVAQDIRVSDDQVKKEYDDRSEQLTHPELRNLLQTVVQSEEKAKQIAAAAKVGGNLTNAAKDNGAKAVELAETEEKGLPEELGKAAFALQLGQVSEPIHSSLGWHVVQVKKITPAGKPELKDIKDQLRASMQRDLAIEATTRILNQLDDQLAAGHGLEDIADELKLRLVKIPAVDDDGKTPDGKDPAEMPNKEDALKAAFGQGSGETSPVVDDRAGHYIIVRTDEVTPSAVKPFDKVEGDVARLWKEREQAKRASDQAEKISKELRGGKPAASFAVNGVTERTSLPVSLAGASDADIPQQALPQVFKLNKGDVTVIALPDRQLVVRLAQINDVDAASMDDAAAGDISADLRKKMPNEMLDQYLQYLRVIFPVSINQDVLEGVREQGNS